MDAAPFCWDRFYMCANPPSERELPPIHQKAGFHPFSEIGTKKGRLNAQGTGGGRSGRAREYARWRLR